MYGQGLTTGQRIFCSSLTTSTVVFEHLGNLALLWTRPIEDKSVETKRLDFSLLDKSQLWLVSNLASAVHGTTPDGNVLHLGLGRMSVPSDVSKILLNHNTSLTECADEVYEQETKSVVDADRV